MPTIKKDHSVLRGHLLDMAILGLPFAFGIGYGFYTRTFPVPLVVGVLILWAIGFFRQQRRFKQFSCPTCGQLLTRQNKFDGSALTFACTKCDTIWDTGFIDSGASSGG